MFDEIAKGSKQLIGQHGFCPHAFFLTLLSLVCSALLTWCYTYCYHICLIFPCRSSRMLITLTLYHWALTGDYSKGKKDIPKTPNLFSMQCSGLSQPNQLFFIYRDNIQCKAHTHLNQRICLISVVIFLFFWWTCHILTFNPDVKTFKANLGKHQWTKPVTISAQMNARQSMRDLQWGAAKSFSRFTLTGLMTTAGAWRVMSEHAYVFAV